MPKLIKNKPSAFYKQRDLEYDVNKIRQVQLGKETISFNHTGSIRNSDSTQTYLKIMSGSSGRLQQFAQAPKSSFISYNLEQMHEVLTLNFFRFMDQITDLDDNSDQDYINNFYKKVSQLTDEELFDFLTDLEKNMTDTAEFNFYGAHQIDFSTIINITARYKEYSLNLPKFINDLKQGNINELRQARIKIPELFNSYRFLDYLLLQVQGSEAKYYLDDLRKQCKTPNWIKYTPLLMPEKFELCWERQTKPDTQEQGVVVELEVEKKTSGVTNFESTDVHQKEIENVSEKQDSVIYQSDLEATLTESDNVSSIVRLDKTKKDTVQDNLFNNQELQTHQEKFNSLINELVEFSSSHNNTNFVQNLQRNFSNIGNDFFSSAQNKDKNTLKESFLIFKSECEKLSQKAENHFKHNVGSWSNVKPILTGFAGVIIAIAATLLTLGIATHYVAKNERLRSQYIDTFFKSESSAKNKSTQYSFKQRFFGNNGMENNGLINEIEQTINNKFEK